MRKPQSKQNKKQNGIYQIRLASTICQRKWSTPVVVQRQTYSIYTTWYIYIYIHIYIYNTIWYNIYFINIKNNIKKKVYVRHSWFMLCCWKYCRLPIFINSFWWHYDGFARILETALLKQYKLRYFHFFKNKDSGMLLVLLI